MGDLVSNLKRKCALNVVINATKKKLYLPLVYIIIRRYGMMWDNYLPKLKWSGF